MDSTEIFGLPEIRRMLFAVLALRGGAVLGIIFTVPARHALPLWMQELYGGLTWPLLQYNLALLILHPRLSGCLRRYPLFISIDLVISSGLILIGGDRQGPFTRLSRRRLHDSLQTAGVIKERRRFSEEARFDLAGREPRILTFSAA